ncbi:protein-PII uridylyltransferase [Streptomyces abyssalis]|uniref:Bifunctional uridylyltransferase/uridylyl-removing enzyme n=1 Tax=Streptomyces abyssalis TaxID=933944 RepID=A0A1E7JHD5_9ACTN|nr:[protein-PII] uridylyltransferase [Streptomyces abyssalis]OEU85873.1 protein-PII uridylyltransferase [Streptomyces abyssalis]OEU92662.1 protein-PII uridylyltransferase [Streptomyces abyssalis]
MGGHPVRPQGTATETEAEPEAVVEAEPGGYAAARLRLLRGEDGTAAGAPRRAELARLTDRWLTGLLGDAGEGFALVAVGGYGRGELSPRSDLDLLLLHDGSAGPGGVARIADRVWYPVWDLGIALDHSVRTTAEARATAKDDLKVQLGLLDARHVAGDEGLTAGMRAELLAQWRAQAPERLPELLEMAGERARTQGELRFLLEPDLKEARGGLRDATALRAVAASWLADAPRGGLAQAREALLDVRDELHLTTGRATDRLALQDQDQVAAALGLADADALLRQVYEAARTVGYAADVTWREVGRVLKSRGGRGSRLRGLLGGRGGSGAGRGGTRQGAGQERTPLAEGVVEHEGEAALARTARPERDPVLPLRAAAAAAQAQLPLALPAVRRLAAAPGLPVPWPAEAREEFITLLGAGEATVPVWEALDAEGLIGRLLPDWERVRCRPQRNPVHRFTVDRHLVETAVRASALTRRVQRPDLLLAAALLHDIGKGWPGDHSVVGETIAYDMACRMGFGAQDADVLARLVRHHLLLVETATRRDLDDPATVRSVADLVGGAGTLELLHALTEADALATGPAAWSAWRGTLVADLVKRVAGVLAGEAVEEHTEPFVPSAEAERLAIESWRTQGPALALSTPGADAQRYADGRGSRAGGAPGDGDAPGGVHGPDQEGAVGDADASHGGQVGVELLVTVPARPAPDYPAPAPFAPGGGEARATAYAMGALPAVAGVLALHRMTVRAADLRVLRLPGTVTGGTGAEPGGPGEPGEDAAVLLLSWRVAAEYGSLPPALRLRADLARALEGSLDIAARLAEREAAYRGPRRRRPLQAPPPRVTVAPDGSELATVLEVRAQDAPGLLYRIGRALEGAGVLVRSAHVSTLGANAVDAFYLTGADGDPLPTAEAAGLARELERELGRVPDQAA